METLLQGAHFTDDRLTGDFTGEIDSVDVRRRRPGYVRLSLQFRGNVLNGGATALARHPRGNALTHWVDLRKHHEE